MFYYHPFIMLGSNILLAVDTIIVETKILRRSHSNLNTGHPNN